MADAGTDRAFPAAVRLRQSGDFGAVFGQGRRFVRAGLVVIAAPGAQCHARLGLAVAKRRLPRAVDRNRVKRVIRESFRRHRTALPALDVVVLVRNSTGNMSNKRLSGQLRSVWFEMSACHVDDDHG